MLNTSQLKLEAHLESAFRRLGHVVDTASVLGMEDVVQEARAIQLELSRIQEKVLNRPHGLYNRRPATVGRRRL
jgi:hypothetical protein